MRDIERVSGEPALVRSQLDAVQPNTGAVESRAEVQLDMRTARRNLEPAEVPGGAEVVVQPADIPRVGNGDRFSVSRDRARPSRGLADTLGVGTELPVPIQVRTAG